MGEVIEFRKKGTKDDETYVGDIFQAVYDFVLQIMEDIEQNNTEEYVNCIHGFRNESCILGVVTLTNEYIEKRGIITTDQITLSVLWLDLVQEENRDYDEYTYRNIEYCKTYFDTIYRLRDELIYKGMIVSKPKTDGKTHCIGVCFEINDLYSVVVDIKFTE